MMIEHRTLAHFVGINVARERARFLDEALQSPAIAVPELVGPRPDRGILQSRRDVDGQVLLDRDALIEVGVLGEIGDAETALAEDALQYVPMQTRERRQCVRIGGVGHTAIFAGSSDLWRALTMPRIRSGMGSPCHQGAVTRSPQDDSGARAMMHVRATRRKGGCG